MNTINPEDQVPKIPNLDLRQHRFLLLNSTAEKEAQKAIIFEAIQKDGISAQGAIFNPLDMAPFYKLICEENGFPIDTSLFEALTLKNEEKIKEIELKLVEAKESEGETEVFDLLKSKAEYLAKIGAKVTNHPKAIKLSPPKGSFHPSLP